MIAEFELHPKLCHIDTSRFTAKDWAGLASPDQYNTKSKAGTGCTRIHIAYFCIGRCRHSSGRTIVLIDRAGQFLGNGVYTQKIPLLRAAELKNYLNPYADNEYIRHCIFSFAAANPAKK
jgi:hypothetical protein